MLLGDLAAAAGRRSTDAIAAWQRIESQNPAFLALVAERLADAYRRLGDAAQGMRVLRSYQAQYPSLDLLNACSRWCWSTRGRAPPATLIKDELRAIRRCSGSTACSRRSCWPRRPSAATTSSW